MKGYTLYSFLSRHLQKIMTYENADTIKKLIKDKKKMKELGKEWAKNLDINNNNYIDIDEFLIERVERYGKC